MKLYMHPVSMTSRPVRLFIAESNIPVEEQVVDLMKGEHYQPPFTTVNPNRQVPVLEDDGFRLTESSAILKYLADKTNSPAYPKDLKQRACVNERMDWTSTQLCVDFVYGLVYPQIFDSHKRPTDAAQQACIDWGREKAANWLKVLDEHWIGPRGQYLCGDRITIADYLGAGFVSLGEIVRLDFSAFPNIQRWLGNMKKLKSWDKVNEVFYGFRDAVKDQNFVTL